MCLGFTFIAPYVSLCYVCDTSDDNKISVGMFIEEREIISLSVTGHLSENIGALAMCNHIPQPLTEAHTSNISFSIILQN